MSVGELAQRWAISLTHAYKLLERNELPSLKAGGALRIPVQAVVDAEQRGGTTAA